MSTLKEIRGQTIRSLSSDPSPVTTGDMWYNSTTKTLKGRQGVGAWTSGGALGTGRHLMGFGGTQTAGIAFGGSAPPNEAITNTELYNGSSWSEVADLSTGRNSGSHIGISTAALYAGGHTGTAYIANSETWNGSSWSEGNDINTGRTGGGSFGITTAGVIAGGYSGPPGVLANVEEYNGTSWSEVNNLPTGLGEQGAIGTLTAGLVFGGTLPPGSSSTIQDATYEYDGTNWTTGGSLVTGVRFSRGGGVQTAALIFGGQTAPAVIATSQSYNGSAFSLDTSLGSAIMKHGAGATAPSTAALSFGGNPKVTATEEFTVAAATKTFTTN